MNDLNTLNDAFAELERRADEHAHRPTPVPTPHAHRGVLVAATVVAVAALAAGTALLATRNDNSGAGQAGGTTHRHSNSSHRSDALKHKLARERRSAVEERRAQVARERAAERAHKQRLAKQQQQSQGRLQVPQDTNDLQKEFAGVLGDEATFTVTIRNVQGSGNDRDVFIGGILTAADGSKGGYDVQILQTAAGERAMCDDPDTMTCDPSTLPDGSSLAVGHEPLSSGAMLREADLITPAGVELVLHVSNQADPKGAGQIYGPNPPLTMDQVTAAATSTNW